MPLQLDVLSSACAAATGFLVQAQAANGSWKDFLLPAGSSDIWVTAYAGCALARVPDDGARAASRAAWKFLEGATGNAGGWSYNAAVPGDADSTLWSLRLAEALGEAESECARRAAGFLCTHVRDDGGLATYSSAEPICAYIGLPPVVPFAGWLQSHACVSAAGANLQSQGPALRQYLLQRQRTDGSWPAYWWFDDEYATAEAVAALAGHGEGADAVARATDWALAREASVAAGGAFALALWLRILALSDHSSTRDAALARGIRSLAERQRPDGSWPPSARLRVPRPDAMLPGPNLDWRPWKGLPPGQPSLAAILQHTFTIYSLDQNAVFTTATVLSVLGGCGDV
jgi:hypothetical protein